VIREEDQVFAKVVARHNLLPPGAIAEGLRRLESSDERRLKEVFLDQGLLSRAQVEELERVASKILQGGPIPGFELIRRIGRGGMGAVYLAKQLSMGGRTVALKVVRLPAGRDRRNARRLLQEARIVGRLNHPNIVKGYDVGVAGDYYYFVMELVEGESLRSVLTKRRYAPAEALRLVRDVASALAHAHDHAVIHRDIKPGNILITSDGTPKLTDLGLAKGPRESTLTRSGATLGTPQYISPEQAKEPRDADARSDLYSLGATLYHMVTGVPPYQGDTLASVISQVLFEPYVPPEDLNPDLSSSFCTLLEKMMVKDPERRYHDAHELIRDIDAVLAGEEIDPLPPASVPRSLARGWGAVTVLAASLVVGLAGLGVGYALFGPGERDPVDRESVPAQRSALRMLLDVRDRYPVDRLANGRLFEARDAYRVLLEDESVASEARGSVRAIEQRLCREAEHLLARLLGEARARILRDAPPRAVLEEFREAFELGFASRFGRDLDLVLPDSDLGTCLSMKFNERRHKLRVEISALVRRRHEAELAELERADGGRPGARIDELEAFEEKLEEDLLLPADLTALREEARERREAWHRERVARLRAMFEEVRDRVEKGRFASAEALLESLRPIADLEEKASDLASFLETRRDAAIRTREAAAASALDDVVAALAARDYGRGFEAAEALRGELTGVVAELPEVEPLRERAEGTLAGLARIDAFWERVGAELAERVGERFKLEFTDDANLKELIDVEGDRIRYRFGAQEQERSLYALDREAAVALARPRVEGAHEDWTDVAWFLLAEAAARSRGSGLLDRARSRLDLGAAESRRRGIEPALEAFEWLATRIREQLDRERRRRQEATRELLSRADLAFEREDWGAARELCDALSSAVHRAHLDADEKRFIEDRLGEIRREQKRDAIEGRFAPGVASVTDPDLERVTVEYGFERATDLDDFAYSRGEWMRSPEGALVLERPRALKGRKGLVYRKRFQTSAKLDVEVTLRVLDDSKLRFLLFSIYGTNYGVMTSEEAEFRQLNLFKGDVENYEEYFDLPGLGYSRPAGIESAPRFGEGEELTFRFELRPGTRTFRFLLNGNEYDLRREWVPPGKRYDALEIRSTVPVAVERIRIRGTVPR